MEWNVAAVNTLPAPQHHSAADQTVTRDNRSKTRGGVGVVGALHSITQTELSDQSSLRTVALRWCGCLGVVGAYEDM